MTKLQAFALLGAIAIATPLFAQTGSVSADRQNMKDDASDAAANQREAAADARIAQQNREAAAKARAEGLPQAASHADHQANDQAKNEMKDSSQAAHAEGKAMIDGTEAAADAR